MKKIILLTLLTLIACSEKKGYTEVRIFSPETDFVEIKYPKVDIFSVVQTDTVYPNKEKEFVFRRKISDPEYAVIIIGTKYLKTVLIPGNEIELIYKDSAYFFNGKKKAALELFDQFDRPPYINTALYKNFTTAAQIENRIIAEKNQELKALEVLDSLKGNDKELFKSITDEINFFYAYKTLKIILSKESKENDVGRDLIELFQSTQEKYPLNTNNKPPSWSDYAEMILVQKPLNELKDESGVTRDSLIMWRTNGTYYPKIYGLIMDYPDAEIAEKVVADQIINALFIDAYDKSLVGVFETFKSDFPVSPYTSFIEPKINNIKEYYKKIARGMPKGVDFIETREINTFNDLKIYLQGDKYFIDVWATWCAPCLKEFKYNSQLDSLLKKTGYKKLYLSVDESDRESKWIESIKYFELTGLNMIANSNLYSDLINNYSVSSIPKYLIIDEEGRIISNDAPKPSEINELAEALLQ